jgi:hypothetical protein
MWMTTLRIYFHICAVGLGRMSGIGAMMLVVLNGTRV